MIYLRADERVPFGAFASVMDAVKQAGITNISIVTRPLDQGRNEWLRPRAGLRLLSMRREAMSSFFQGGEHLQQELAPEPLAAGCWCRAAALRPLSIAIVLYGIVGGFFHHNLWGGAGPGGAIQVNITSAIPLPSDHPPNQNVLATEKPSEAPAPPEPKAKQAVDETAIPILGKPKKPEHSEVERNSAAAAAGSQQSRTIRRAGWIGRCRGLPHPASPTGRPH